MAKLTIPSNFLAGVSDIRKLDDASARSIRESLDGVRQQAEELLLSHQTSIREMAIKAVMSTPNVQTDKSKLGEAIAALYRVRSSREESVDVFANQVCDALERISDDRLRIREAERPQLRQNLVLLLGSKEFSEFAKIRDLNAEHERTFCNARILTDMRPVFGTDLSEGPQALFISHVLRLAYHKGGENIEEVYVSLSAEDLRELRKTIERAETKAKSLRSLPKDMRLLGVPRE
jgi:hypothetical protein